MQRWTYFHGKIAAQISQFIVPGRNFLRQAPCLTSQSRTSPPTWTVTRCSTSFEFGGWTIASVRGVGIGAVGNPFFGGEAVNICLHSRSDVGDPFCSNIRVCLCITDQCSLPPAEGSPICVCFNKKLAGGDGWSGQQLFDWSTSFGDTFWLCYIFCMGLGFSAPQANGHPIFAVQTKELCIKGGTKLTTPMEGGKLCSMVSTRLCFWEQCALPPAEGAPMFVCFNLLNKKGASAKPLAYGS